MTVGGVRTALQTVVSGRDLDRHAARDAMDEIMDGAASPVQIAGLLTALRTKGETVDEICGMVDSMRAHATTVKLKPGAVDTCGTGGDGSMTFNISTAAALVAAGAKVRVAKHGNRAASSRCGSADVLEALGVRIALPPAGVTACVEDAGMGFFFAPAYHPAMRHAGPVRSELGVRTVFNVLGPLANPAGVRHQALGVADPAMAPLMASVLQRLGHEHALVFSGSGGLDELSLEGPSRCLEVTPEGVSESEIDPAGLGLGTATKDDLRGGDAAENAARVRAVLAGEPGPSRDIVLLNAAAALVAAGASPDLRGGVERASASIDSGAARRVLERLVNVSNRPWA
ncbi:MAG: anthranilate phosphoribosyltransferase [Candidatus Dormibacteraeota bacterium]|nr:anthranilate phosphoribosyltransferase [Candidatus Dormibacteraeota bacterium]